jgi:hypothetical protein
MGPWDWAQPDQVEVESANVRVRAVQRRLSFFLDTHPCFDVARPWETESGRWEVTTPADGVLSFDQDQPVYMVNTLEERYP